MAKPTITEVAEVYVNDGKGGNTLVRKGERVSILEHNDFLNKSLGLGPHEVTWTGIWKCGRGYCLIKSDNGKKMGINASKLKIALT